jgi:exosortase
MNTMREELPKKVSLVLLAVAALLLLCALPYAAGYGDYRKTILRILIERWFDGHDTTWQYGALVPFAVGWLVWRRRQRLAEQPPRVGWMGLPLMMLALFSYFVGYKANSYYFGFAAVQLFVAGAVIWLFGWSWMRQLAFPWLILGMMWPLVFLEDRLGFPLRLISVKGIEWLASAMHLPIIAQGTALFSVSKGEAVGSWMQLQVEGPCSGMNTLFALMFIAALFSHHTQPTNVRRWLLFTLSIPLAILGNMVRIGVLILGCRWLGQDVAVGHEQNDMTTYHLLAGLLVFVVAFLGLQAVSSWMHRWWPRKPKPLPADVTGAEPQKLKPSLP